MNRYSNAKIENHMTLSNKNWILTIFALILMLFLSGLPIEARVKVKGYYRKNGTYVSPHYRSNPDHLRLNNWSTKGDYNPYTGKQGTVNPYKSYGC